MCEYTYPEWPLDNPAEFGRASEVRESLAGAEPVLFAAKQPIVFEVARFSDYGLDAEFLESESAIEEYISSSAEPRSGCSDVPPESSYDARFFLLKPSYGRAELPVTRRGMLLVLSALRVFPDFYRYLRAFARKSFPRDEGFGGFDHLEASDSNGVPRSLECCYLLKYVQKRDTAVPKSNPWSIRQALIYQKVTFSESRRDHILVRLSDKMSQRLSGAIGQDKAVAQAFAADWTQMHSACIDTVDDGFRDYMNYLDESVSKLFDRVMMSGVEPSRLREFETPEQSSRDMKALQSLADQARRLAHVIDVNIDTFEAMVELSKTLICSGEESPYKLQDLHRFRARLERNISRHRSILKATRSLVDRSQALFVQLGDAVDLRNSEIRRLNMEETKLVAAATLQLSERSEKEARILKTLTIIALVFAPASFAADFLQMGYINVQETGFQIDAAPGLQLYAALALPLITVTMTIYAVMEFVKRGAVKGAVGHLRDSPV